VPYLYTSTFELPAVEVVNLQLSSDHRQIHDQIMFYWGGGSFLHKIHHNFERTLADETLHPHSFSFQLFKLS